MKKALITGITGQDGSYLTEFLLSKGYEVHGIIRKSSTFNTRRIDHIYRDPHEEGARLFLHYGDLADMGQISNIIYNLKPDEVYNLGAQSHVKVSFDMPEYTGNITGLGNTRILESILRSGNHIKLYQASSSEMFGVSPSPQNECTPFKPRSPYAAAKLYAHYLTQIYREGYSIYTCSGIMFNHESPRRGETFVTRKITMAVARILAGTQKVLYLGNLDAKRDWGYAPDYIEAMWIMLQQKEPKDYVIGTGIAHSVREFLEEAFGYVDLNYEDYVRIDPKYYRPLDLENLIADSSKARKDLGWNPKIGFNELVKIMVDSDMKKLGLTPVGEGYDTIDKMYSKPWWGVD